MNRITIKGLGPLVVAAMFVITETSILYGQRDDGEMVFEAPIPVRTEPTTRMDTAQRTANSIQSPKPNTPIPRKTAVMQAGGIQPLRTQLPGTQTGITQVGGTIPSSRNSIPGTDPKRTFSNKSSAVVQAGSPQTITPHVNTAQTPQTTEKSQIIQTQAIVSPGVGLTTPRHPDPTQGLTLDGADPTLLHRRKVMQLPPMTTSPTDRGTPQYRGNVLGLNPGESAVERCLQMQGMLRDFELQTEDLRQQNAGLQARIKDRDEQILAAFREIKAARKELALAKNDLDRSKRELQTLQDKVRTAEREHSAVLQSMGPLLQQLLESDDVGSLPPNPAE